MLKLIMLGILGQEMQVANGWFWGLYTASWIITVLEMIFYSLIMIFAIKNATSDEK